MEREGNAQILLKAATIGSVAGMRSMAAPARLAHRFSAEGLDAGNGQIARLLSSESIARVLAVMAAGEMLADKASFVVDRTSLVPLVGRAVIGSLSAAALSFNRNHPVLLPAAVGAVSAIASTFAAFHVRRLASKKFNVPDRLLGLIEDAVVLGVSRAVTEKDGWRR